MTQLSASLARLFSPTHGKISRAEFWIGLTLLLAIQLGSNRLIHGSFFPYYLSSVWLFLVQQTLILLPECVLAMNRTNDIGWGKEAGFSLVAGRYTCLMLVAFVFQSGTPAFLADILAIALFIAQVALCGFLPPSRKQMAVA